jgi:hypothetical protein
MVKNIFFLLVGPRETACWENCVPMDEHHGWGETVDTTRAFILLQTEQEISERVFYSMAE